MIIRDDKVVILKDYEWFIYKLLAKYYAFEDITWIISLRITAFCTHKVIRLSMAETTLVYKEHLREKLRYIIILSYARHSSHTEVVIFLQEKLS